MVGGYVADGALLDKILHTIAKSAIDDHPEIQQFVKLDAEKSGEVNFHEISIPIPLDANDREKVVQLVGENLDIIIGVGKEKAYLAVGRNAKSTLKKAIERSDQVGAVAVPPLEMSLNAEPMAAFAVAVGKPEDRPKAELAASELKKTPDKDHVVLTVLPISDGVQIHLEVQQGLIRLFSRVATMGSAPQTPITPPTGQ